MTARIVIVLPRKELFARDRFGAISLVVEAYVAHSAYRDATEVLGVAVSAPRDPGMFRAVAPKDRWWRRRTLGFAHGVADYLAKVAPRHIDVHNRVEAFDFLPDDFRTRRCHCGFTTIPRKCAAPRPRASGNGFSIARGL